MFSRSAKTTSAASTTLAMMMPLLSMRSAMALSPNTTTRARPVCPSASSVPSSPPRNVVALREPVLLMPPESVTSRAWNSVASKSSNTPDATRSPWLMKAYWRSASKFGSLASVISATTPMERGTPSPSMMMAGALPAWLSDARATTTEVSVPSSFVVVSTTSRKKTPPAMLPLICTAEPACRRSSSPRRSRMRAAWREAKR